MSENNKPQNNSNKAGGSAWIAMVLIVVLVLCFCISMCVGSVVLFASIDTSATSSSGRRASIERVVGGSESSDNKFLSIPITGAIMTNSSPGGGFDLFGGGGVTYGYDVKKSLEEAADKDYAGVILEISSPGGTITGSAAISDGVEYYRQKTGKPVVAFVRDQAASGGYWAAAAADEIIADSGAITGSIGVIFGPLKYYNGVVEEGSSLFGNVVTQNGIETTYITGGGSKDIGNPYRRVTEEEMRVLQTSVSNEYDKFVRFVSERRGIAAADIKTKVKAHIYGNEQAIDLKLIDASGNRTDAFERLKELSKVSDYKVVQLGRESGFWDAFFGVSSDNADSQSSGASLAKSCVLCGQMLVLYGNPEDYRVL